MLHSSQAPGARAWYCVARAHCVMPSGANDLALGAVLVLRVATSTVPRRSWSQA